ncbi:MAG: cation:proton antiporter [Campylobacterales bacterium]
MHSFAPEIMLVTILALVVFSDTLADRMKIPSVFLLLIGSYAVYHFFPIAVPLDLRHEFDTIILLCIPLIFMGDALHLRFADVRKFGFEIFYLAVFAVGLSIAVGASLYQLDLFEPLSLGGYVALFAINMATDAVSVQSVLSRFEGIGHDIKVLIEGESLGNDATAVIAFFFVGLPWMMSGSIDAFDASLDAVRVFAVSLGLGIVMGFGFYLLMKLVEHQRGEFFIFVVEGYAAYVLGEELHVSGILTLIAAIIATKAWIDTDLRHARENEQRRAGEYRLQRLYRQLRFGGYESTTEQRLEYIFEMAREFGYIATVMIFFTLVEVVDFGQLWHYRYEILAMFVATTLIRALSMAKFAVFGQRFNLVKPVGAEGWFILTFSGMKGALSIILVHMIPDSFEHKALFESVTIGVVMLSIFGYGTTLWLYFTLKKMRGAKQPLHHEG